MFSRTRSGDQNTATRYSADREIAMNILIAEDDAVSRILIRRTLEDLGHECRIARDGEEAWELWLADPAVDVIVSDWMMPGVDGPELCRRIREASDPNRGYPYLIFLTTLSDRDHRLAGLDAGADDYLTKPLDPDELEVRLKAAGRITAMQRQLALQNEKLEGLNAELGELASQDALTGLANRRSLAQDLEVLADGVERYGRRYSALLCDVDNFKGYNDRYGHLRGDDALRRVAGVLRDNLRPGDTCYRYGGEEFLILLPEQDLQGARIAAERLRQSVEGLGIENAASGAGGVLTASFGLAELHTGRAKTPEELLQEADEALYRAKVAGRNRVEVHPTEAP